MTTFAELNATLIACRRCPRLVEWREKVASEKRRAYQDWEYWGKPVPGFGDPAGRVLVIGLAPGAHGSNRTGRNFTGDSSGDFLYPALYRAGFANQPHASHRNDGLSLQDMYITASCRCAPPENKPTPAELANCRPYLAQEISLLNRVQVIVALGKIAFDSVLQYYQSTSHKAGPAPILAPSTLIFAHGAQYLLGPDRPRLVASYHPSRQNTQTGRLTAAMFDEIWSQVKSLLC